MSGRWVAEMARDEAEALGALRTTAGVEACDVSGAIWLRGRDLDDELQAQILKVPGIRLYDMLDDGRLRERGRRIPEGHPPAGPWVRLSAGMEVEVPPAAYAGEPTRRVPLRLVRGGAVREANVLVTDMARWTAYAVDAPAVRLKALAFAVTSDGRAVIRGVPVPPISGERYVMRGSVAAPGGYCWDPPVDAAVLDRLLGLAPGDLALLHPDGPCDLVRAGCFVRATRSAVRMSLGGGPP